METLSSTSRFLIGTSSGAQGLHHHHCYLLPLVSEPNIRVHLDKLVALENKEANTEAEAIFDRWFYGYIIPINMRQTPLKHNKDKGVEFALGWLNTSKFEPDC